MIKLINNQETRLYDELKAALTNASEVLLSVAYFSINALFELSNEFKKVSSIKILIDNKDANDTRFGYDQPEWQQYLDLKGKFKSETALTIINEKCSIRSGNVGGQKFIVVKNPGKTTCFSIVPQDLTVISLGLASSDKPIIISAFEDTENQYTNLFNQVWDNSPKDIKDQVKAIIKEACIHHAPESIYKLSLYNIFQHAIIDEVSEQRLKKIGFKNTLIWGMLYNFQQDAVLGAIDKIETFGGCIIADSVGLGKTF